MGGTLQRKGWGPRGEGGFSGTLAGEVRAGCLLVEWEEGAGIHPAEGGRSLLGLFARAGPPQPAGARVSALLAARSERACARATRGGGNCVGGGAVVWVGVRGKNASQWPLWKCSPLGAAGL